MGNENTSPFGFITKFLRDSNSQDQLAIAKEQGNNLATQGYGRDLEEMSYAGLVAKYGQDVAQNRFRIQNGDNRLFQHRNDSSPISTKIGDTALDATASLVSTAGNTIGALAVRPLAKIMGVDPNAAAAINADLTAALSSGIQGGRSSYANENSRIQGIAAQLDAADSAQKYQSDIAAGESEFTASLSQVGRDILNAGSRIGSDPESLRQIIGGSLGSLAPSAALAKGAAIAAGRGITLLSASTRAASMASSTAAVAAIGATEASGTYADTMNEVMSYSTDVLSASPVYAGLLQEGYTPLEAKTQLASMTANEAFLKNLPAATALGVLTHKFEMAPIGSFRGSGIVHGMRSIGLEGGEEAGQSATSTLATNSSIQNNVDASRTLSEGVGEQITQGFIGGLGQAGVSAAPATVIGTTKAAIGAAVNASSSKTFNDPLRNEIMGRGNIAQRTTQTARAVTAPIVDRAKGNDTTSEIQAVAASRDAIKAVNASPEFTDAVTQPDNTPVPQVFQSVSVENSSFLSQVAHVTKKLAEKRLSFSDAEAAFAGAVYSKLRGMVSSMPESVRTKAVQILQSPQAKRVEARLAKLDQNQTPPVKIVTPDIVSETVSIAKTNPSNVSPETVTKILQQSGEQISPEDTKLLHVASNIASIVNDRQGKEVSIAKTKQIGLAKKSGKPIVKSKSAAETSRSFRVQGFTASDGKTPLRSLNDFAADIFKAAQSPDGTILSKEGTPVSAKQLIKEMGDLVTHMNNKVAALNESFTQNNRKGVGPNVKFAGLVPGKGIVAANKFNKTVFYNRSNPASVAVAKQVAADQNAAVQVYNELRTAFPEHFSKLPEMKSVSLKQDHTTYGYINLDALNAEINAQEAADLAAAQTKSKERRLRKDAVLKTSQSLIEQTDPQTAVEEANNDSLEGDAHRRLNVRLARKFDENFKLDQNGQDGSVWSQTFIRLLTESNAGDLINIARLTKNASVSYVYDNLQTSFLNGNVKFPFNDFKEFQALIKGDSKQSELFAKPDTTKKEIPANKLHRIDQNTDQNNPTVLDEVVSPKADTTEEKNQKTDQSLGASEIAYQQDVEELANAFKEVEKHDPNIQSGKTDLKQWDRANILLQQVITGKSAEVILDALKAVSPKFKKEFIGNDVYDLQLVGSISKNTANLLLGQLDQSSAQQSSNTQDIVQTPESLDTADLQVSTRESDNETPNIHETYSNSYQEDADTNAPKNLDDYLESAKSSTTMNQNTVAFAEKLVRPMVNAMNTRLQRAQVNGQPLLKILKEGVVQNYRQYRNTAIVNKETGKYDQNLAELAGLAMIDWMSSVHARDPNQLSDTLEELGISATDLTDSQLEGVLYGVSVSQAKATLAKDILRMWGRKENVDAPLSYLVGIAEGVAAEMITVIANNPNLSLLEIKDLPLGIKDGKPQVTQTIIVKGLGHVQDQINNMQTENTNKLAREELFNIPKEEYSIGSKIVGIPVNQSRGNVRLSQLERKAIKKMQDTPHFKNEVNASVIQDGIGEEALQQILGFTQGQEFIENNTYRRSVEGKNISVLKNIKDAFRLLDQLKNGKTPVYYPVGITKVGRHQMQGPNPQANKLIRSLVAPTWSEINLENQEDMDLFWLGIAQASDLFKVEKNSHSYVLSAVQNTFNKEYRVAVNMVKGFLASGSMDGKAFADAVGQVEPQVLSAIIAVADMESHVKAGSKTFRTSLSFELDGLTNGAANMMVNFSQGKITKSKFRNFNRIGLFLGQIRKTVNSYFSARGPNGEKNLDLYEKTSGESQYNMYTGLKNKTKEQQAITLASARFAARFGNFTINEKTGNVEMTRDTAKNPMTKVNYGSSAGGVGRGIADDMILEFYRKIQGIPTNVDLETYFAYPGMQEDVRILFGDTLPNNMQLGAFEFPSYAIGKFKQNVSDTLGKVLTETTKNIIGDDITELNDMLVFSTNVQAEYVQLTFQSKLEALAERRAQEGKIHRTKKGKAIITELSRRDYQSIVKEMEALSPIFVSNDQTLAVGGFQTKKSDFELSSAMNGKLNQKSNLPMPEDVGVAAIPYSVIGTGDAMMMNFIFGSDGAPSDVLGVFDGLDIPVSKIREYGPYVNQQVMKTWERDVLGMVTANFNGFLGNADPTVLKTAFQNVKDRNKKTTVVAGNAAQLASQMDERHRQNAAFKAVLKRISVSVDQMGGSGNGFTRGEENMSLSQINREIQKELSKKDKPVTEEIAIGLQESTALSVLKGLRLSAEQSKVAEILKGLLPETRVVFGSLNDLNQYRQDNYPDDGQILEAKSNFDTKNNTIFMATTKTESLLHEMVHAATFGKVLDHYTGINTNEAVTRLEALMNEFLAMNVDGVHIREAKASILRQRAQNDAASKAAALNEFMAYALTNQEVSKTLKSHDTKTLKSLGQKVIQLMRRLMGSIPTSMFDHVVFNTKVLNEDPIETIDTTGGNGDGGNGGNNNGSSSSDGTNNGREFTNFWIKTISDYIEETFSENRQGRRSVQPIMNLQADANRVLDSFRQEGLIPSPEQRHTFRAIYMVIRSQIALNPQSVIGLTKIFKHIEEHMTPDMFGNSTESPHIYSAVVNAFGGKEAAAVLLALSQTSTRFRNVLDQIPDPEGNVQIDGSLKDFMGKFSEILMKRVMGTKDFSNKNTIQIMDELSDGIVELDKEREWFALRQVNNLLNKVDSYIYGRMSGLSDAMMQKNEQIKAESNSKFVRVLSNIVTLGTNVLSKENSAQTADVIKKLTHGNIPLLNLVPVRELVSEMIGTDANNVDLIRMQSEINQKISGMRNAYRQNLPEILQNIFHRSPEAEEWQSMHVTLGQSDITRFIKPNRIQRGMQMLEEGARRRQRIKELETALESNLLPHIAQDAKDKAQQLANYMNGHGAGKLLMRNAYAIVKNLDGPFEPAMVDVVDELVSIYFIDQMDPSTRETTVQLWQEDPRAVTAMITYLQGLNEDEDAKHGISEQAKLNGQKGYIPNIGKKDTRIIIATDENQNKLEKLGYRKLGAYTGDVDSVFPRSYYVTSSLQGGQYTQGVMQNIAATYRGVDINTGLSVTGNTSGYVSGDGQVARYIEILNRPDYVQKDDKEAMIPVFDSDGTVMGFERAINPDVLLQHMQPEENLAMMIGAWTGRHVEEKLAYEYNRALVDKLDELYHNRESGTDNQFENLKDTKDPIYAEAFKLWPQAIKEYADSKFDGNGPMIKKDQINNSTGYREFSVADFWSGKTRLPKDVAEIIKNISTLVLGKNAMYLLTTGEAITHGAVSTAKDVILIRSLIVPAANTFFNVLQLVTNGVPLKTIQKQYRSKLAEIETYNQNLIELMDLDAKLRLAANNANQRRIIQDKINVIKALNAKMTIAPMIDVGAYTNLSEGMTELDASISKGKFGDIMENMANALPGRLTDMAHYGVVSKSTKMYKVANRATQYGDFLAKSIYYDHLIESGREPEEAVNIILEEFVNFGFLPGRLRSSLERNGLSWFMAFKLRVLKTGLKQMRDHPVRAIAMNQMFPNAGSPINDNIAQVILDGRLGYSTGYDMFFAAPGLNPWVNLLGD